MGIDGIGFGWGNDLVGIRKTLHEQTDTENRQDTTPRCLTNKREQKGEGSRTEDKSGQKRTAGRTEEDSREGQHKRKARQNREQNNRQRYVSQRTGDKQERRKKGA